MSIRAYLAAKAMAALVLDVANQGELASKVAALAYEVADAMLAERSKP